MSFYFSKKSVELDNSRQVNTKLVFNVVNRNSSIGIISDLFKENTTWLSRTRLDRVDNLNPV